jgi:putative sterol carrier protein
MSASATSLADRFGAMSPAEVHAFFAETDVLEITETIRRADDEDLRRLIAIEAFREEGVVVILERFREFADAERLQAIDGVVRFELFRGGPGGRKEIERHTARFAAGEVVLDDQAQPDVTISADMVDFIRLVTGERNAALLYLGDRLHLSGDELLALDVGCVFTPPGGDAVAVDPTTLDPVDVATAVAQSGGRHLREVMRGSFRPIVLSEVFRRFPDFIDPSKAARLRLSVGFRIGGRADDEVDRYTVHVRDGVCTIETDPPQGQRRDATISLDGADFLRLATGQLHPVKGVLSGAMKVRGDKGKALALNGAMCPPQPRSAQRPTA